jgi:hypothetical protein
MQHASSRRSYYDTSALISPIYPINSITSIPSRHFTVSYYIAELLFFVLFPALCFFLQDHTYNCACASYNYDPSSIRPQPASVPIQRVCKFYVSTRHVAMITYAFLVLTPALAYSRTIYPQPCNDARPSNKLRLLRQLTYLRDP